MNRFRKNERLMKKKRAFKEFVHKSQSNSFEAPTFKELGDAMGISPKTISKWHKEWRENGKG